MPEPIEVEFVNREDVFTILGEMRSGARDTRILLIKGAEGMGKSWILRRVQLQNPKLPSTLVDLALSYGQDPQELVRGLKGQIAGVDWTEVDRILDQADQGYRIDFQGYNQVKLLEIIITHFGLDDLRTICFNLNMDLDDLPGEGKTGKARELIFTMSRQPEGLKTLVEELRRVRQNIPWAGVMAPDGKKALHLPGADDNQAKDLQLERLADTFVTALRPFTRKTPALLLIDTYEKATKPVRDWLLNLFMPSIRQGVLAGVLVLVAGQEVPEFNRDWRLVVESTELKGLPRTDIRKYWVELREQPERTLAFAIRYSGGIPSMLAQMADIGENSSQS